MSQDELKRAITAALGEIAPEADLATLSGSVPFRDQLDLDSMDFLHFVQALDKKLGVEVPEADYPKLMTLDDCVKYLLTSLPLPAGERVGVRADQSR